MKIQDIGRNDPCPCGSGKKFKKCCLTRQASNSSDREEVGASVDLRQAMEGLQIESLAEAQAFAERHMQQRNKQPLDEFHGLSPEQIHHMLHFPFSSPELIRFPEVPDANPTAPIMILLRLLIDAIGDKGLKPTAKGNLPRKFCRESALAYWGEEVYLEKTRYGGINREEDFSDLHITRLTAELAGLIRKYKGKFILSRKCRALLKRPGPAALYPLMFRAYVEQFNWAYRDRYPELRFIQTAFLFTLYLLARYGDSWRSHEFYEDSFLCAFPGVLDELPQDHFFTPEEEVCRCYTWRTLVNFVGFFGLATVDPVSDKRFRHKYRVKGLPFLRDTVQFQMPG